MTAPGTSVSVALGVAIMALVGEHDLNTADDVRRSADGVIESGLPCVIDLREAEYIDSTILGVLLETRGRCRDAGVGFATVLSDAPAGMVRRLLDITQMAEVFGATSSFEAAIASAK